MTNAPTYQTATFSLGDFTCTVINDALGSWSLYNAFKPVPKDRVDAVIKAGNYKVETPRQGNVLLIDTGTNKILIDAGNPTDRGGQMLPTLKAIGISADDIDYIAITHGDGDHIGGLGNYPNAKIIMPAHAYKLWTEDVKTMTDEFIGIFGDNQSEEEIDMRSAGRTAYAALVPTLKNRLTLVELEEEFLPGFRFVDAAGHRSDHVAVEIGSKGETLLHIVDAFRHPAQLYQPDMVAFFDSYHDQTLATMKRLMRRAADKNALVFGAHIIFPSIVRITHGENGLEWHDIGGGF